MKIEQISLIKKLKDTSKNYKVPFYQRSYKWGSKENLKASIIKDLIKDIYDLAVKNYKRDMEGIANDESIPFNPENHYIGNMIFKDVAKSIKVVDGQQRISTLMLIARYLVHYLDNSTDKITIEKREGSKYSKGDKAFHKVREDYMNIYSWSDEEEFRYKIDYPEELDKLNNILKQNSRINDIILKAKKDKNDENLYGNAMFVIDEVFKKTIKDWEKENKDVRGRFFNVFFEYGLLNLVASSCSLEVFDDEGVIFENSNTKGSELKDEELIKNYIIMKKSRSQVDSNVYNNLFRDFHLGENQDQILVSFWRFFSVYFKNQGLKSGKFKNYNDIKSILEEMTDWKSDGSWEESIRQIFCIFYLIHISLTVNKSCFQENIIKLENFFCKKFLKRWFEQRAVKLVLCLSIKKGYEYNFYFQALGVAIGKLLKRDNSTNEKGSLYMDERGFKKLDIFCRTLNNYFLTRLTMDKACYSTTVPMFGAFVNKSEGATTLDSFKIDCGRINSIQELQKYLINENESHFTSRKKSKPKAYFSWPFNSIKTSLKDKVWLDSALTNIKRVLIFLEVQQSTTYSILSLITNNKLTTIEHIHSQSTNDNYVHFLGNLTLLEDDLNKMASNAPFSKKSSIYIKSSLLTTKLLLTNNNSKWGKIEIEERSSKIVESLLKVT